MNVPTSRVRVSSWGASSILVLSLTATPALPDAASTGANGIQSQGLTLASGGALNGTGAHIGQVEVSRPGRPGALAGFDLAGEWFTDGNANMTYDGPANDLNGDGLFTGVNDVGVDLNLNGVYNGAYVNGNASVIPAGVFVQNGPAPLAPIIQNAPPANWPPGGLPPNTTPQANFTAADHNIEQHAEQVAGVMISTAGATRGVAQSAALWSSAYAVPVGNGHAQVVQAAQTIAQQGNNQVSAINYSFGENIFVANDLLAGGSLVTAGLDWLGQSNQQDVLNVVAGNEGTRFPLPTDHFNGVTVGYTQLDGANVFRVLNAGNTFDEDAAGPRRSIDLVAPGTNINMPILNNGTGMASGTSFAAPHVTGTVGLLQQYANDRIANSAPRFDNDALGHEVMKVVLMNSVDKLIDNGTVMVGGNAVPNGFLLNMTRTVLDAGELGSAGERFIDGNGNNMRDAGEPFADSNNNGVFDASTLLGGFYDSDGDGAQDPQQNWLQSDAFTTSSIPLDEQLGTGQLNASRAVMQFAAGEYDAFGPGPAADVPLIGWDRGLTIGAATMQKYKFTSQLLRNSFVSLTLAWDRMVTLNDNGADGMPNSMDTGEGDNLFTVGESFTTSALTDLDLYLLPAGSTTIGQSVCSSNSSVDSVEHIFCQIPATGNYEFWVNQVTAPVGNQLYGLAWWAVPEPSGCLPLCSAVSLLLAQWRRRRRSPELH